MTKLKQLFQLALVATGIAAFAANAWAEDALDKRLKYVYPEELEAHKETVRSIKDLQNGELYSIDWSPNADYRLDKMLEADREGVLWMLFTGLNGVNFLYPKNTGVVLKDAPFPGIAGIELPFACSSFAAKNAKGENLVGRNFDYDLPMAHVLLRVPRDEKKGRYASVGTVDAGWLNYNVGELDLENGTNDLSYVAMFPYLCMDGMNEKGLMVTILSLDGYKDPDTGKPTWVAEQHDSTRTNITITLAIRCLLDRADSTETAVNMLTNFNFRAATGLADLLPAMGIPYDGSMEANYHYLLSDSSGDTRVVEWTPPAKKGGNWTAFVTNAAEVTNFYLADGYGHGSNRWEILRHALAQQNHRLEERDAMDLCRAVAQRQGSGMTSWTHWSLVYNLDTLSANIATLGNYDEIFPFRLDGKDWVDKPTTARPTVRTDLPAFPSDPKTAESGKVYRLADPISGTSGKPSSFAGASVAAINRQGFAYDAPGATLHAVATNDAAATCKAVFYVDMSSGDVSQAAYSVVAGVNEKGLAGRVVKFKDSTGTGEISPSKLLTTVLGNCGTFEAALETMGQNKQGAGGCGFVISDALGNVGVWGPEGAELETDDASEMVKYSLDLRKRIYEIDGSGRGEFDELPGLMRLASSGTTRAVVSMGCGRLDVFLPNETNVAWRVAVPDADVRSYGVVAEPTSVPHATATLARADDGTVTPRNNFGQLVAETDAQQKVTYKADEGYYFPVESTVAGQTLGSTVWEQTFDVSKSLTAVPAPTVKLAEQRLPDYAEETGKDWLYNHAIKGKAYAGEAAESDVDLFYVYPTLFGNEQIVIDGFRGIDDATMRSSELSFSTAAGAFDGTARCFADMTHVYAPFYRQLSLDAATDITTNAQGEVVADANARYVKTISQGPSYADITNALDVYFAKWNNGRKLVLAGHSQGSAHLRLLMRDYFTLPENRDKAKRVICSYQIGYGMSAAEMADITEKTGITFATNATDVGVIVSYNTMGEDSSGNSTLLPPDTLAINPITWTRATDLADKSLNLGALTNAIGKADVIVPHLYGAQVVDTGFNRGEVVVCKELNGEVLEPGVFGTGSLHTKDYGAYWENLRANAYDRGGKLAGYCKLCTTNFPAHLCVSNATVYLKSGSPVVDSVAGTVWIPTNGFEGASVELVAEKGYRLIQFGKERQTVSFYITGENLLPNGEFLIDPGMLSVVTVEWIQRKPDYADATGKDWLFNHDIAAKRYEGEPAADPGVDLFYFYPTSVFVSDDHVVDGVCDIDDPWLRGPNGASNSWNKTAAVFGDFTHVYAPYYRQTPSDVEMPIGEQPNANAEMREYWYKRAPYEDVTNALTHYFTVINPDGKRPFIFAGHSHGSGMLTLVMEHFFAENGRKAWLKNMVACYAIGWGVSKDWEAKLNDDLDMYVATNATDAGVYVFWNTYGPNTNAIETILYPDPAESAASVNPILWTREKDAYAPASLNLGAWTADDSGAVRPGLYDASNNVANGTLICSSKDVESHYLVPVRRMFGEHSLHGWDYKLYWENLRANALQRIKTMNARRFVDDYAQIPLAGTPIDYADPYNWVTNTGSSKPLDVFYVYPTMMLEGDSTVVPVTDAMKAKAYTNAYLEAASAFAGYANVLVPAYRQMNMAVPASALYPEPRDFIDFFKGQTPRTDIFAALDYYFTNLNAGVQRPFVLAGHSQGSCMLKIAFEDYFRSNDVRKGYLKKMVAAYPLGYSFAQDWFDVYYPDKKLAFATNATDKAALVSWNTEGPNATQRSFVIENGALVINPMNWTTNVNVWSETVPDAMIQERTATDYDYTLGTYALVTTNATDYLPTSSGMGEKSLHGKDWTLWYDQIKVNGFVRYAAFADLKEVSTNNIPTVADTTWKVTVGGQEAVKSPIDGTYYVAADAKSVKLVYTLDAAKAAANFVFPNKKTTVSFTMKYQDGKWVPSQSVENILKDTQVIYNQRKPDYTKAKDWVLNHFLKPNEARDVAGEPSDDPGVDLVYVYGTVAMTNAFTTVNGFADLDDTQMRGDEANHAGGVWGMIPGSVKAFSDYTRVYMPFYRQMTLCGATNVMAKVGMEYANKAFAEALQEGVAYEDLEAALDAYFKNWNKGRPFILAGCSQGAAMLRNMVERYFTQNQDKLDQLVACYGIAFGVTKDWADQVDLMTDGKIHFATNATERGVYISWNTVGPGSTAFPNGLVPPDAISINPLTWTTEATPAGVDKNYGSLTNAATGAVVAHLYDATVDTVNGVVVSTNLPASDYIPGLEWFGDKSLHTWEMPAWWENIRDNAFRRIETATGKRPRCGTPNDYSKDENWMVRVKVKGEGEGEVKPVDVFFLYPTTDGGRSSGLIAEIDDAMKATAWDAYQQDTMGFWSYANMYAPYYRQASFLGLQAQSGVSGLKNFCSTHVVKTDVFAALDYYFTNLNSSAKRPYILVGHSQGSCNIKLVIEEYMKQDKTHEAYKEKLVAAYAMGFAVEKSWCEKAEIDFAEGESDTGVILTWNCEGPDAEHGSVNFLTEPDDGQAINPLNWKTDDTYAGIERNLGSVITNAAGEYVWGKGNADAQLSPEAGSAYGFRPGALVVTNTTAAYSPSVLGYQCYHGNDGAFFQRNVGANGYTRYAAFVGLAEIVTNGLPKVADATLEVKVKGEGEQWMSPSVSPVDGKLYAPADAAEVKVVYTLNGEAASRRFVNGETSTSFPMKKEGGQWTPLATEADVKAATKTGEPTLKLGVVAQRYPWNGTVDVGYKATFWPEGKQGAVEVTVGESVTTNDFTIAGKGTVIGTTAIKLPDETKGKATFKAVE